MDLLRVTQALETEAIASDETTTNRLVLIYIAPGDGGLFLFRPGCGAPYQLGGSDDQDFGASLRAAVEKIWPESSKKTRAWLRIASDFIAHSPIARGLGAGGRDDDDDDDD